MSGFGFNGLILSCLMGLFERGGASKGSPRRVDGISQKGRWDLPQGSMGPPRRVNGTSHKGRWDLPPMSTGAAGGAHLSLVKKRCLIGIDAIVHSSVQRGVGKLSTPPCHETDPNQP